MPLNVDAQPPSEVGKAVQVTWTAPPGEQGQGDVVPAITHYNVQYRQDESHAWTKSSENVPADPSHTAMQYQCKCRSAVSLPCLRLQMSVCRPSVAA